MIQSILNILQNIPYFLFNLFLKVKYKFFNQNIKNDEININEIFIINSVNQKINFLQNEIINHLNDKLKYSKHINLNKVFEFCENQNDIIVFDYSKNKKNYLFNIVPSNEKGIIFFPLYSQNEMLKKNMNKITEIYSEEVVDEKELLYLLEKYGGPLNDFYFSKKMSIPLSRIYSKKLKTFPFREGRYTFCDTFLNEYSIDSNNCDEILFIKNTLDDKKIVAVNMLETSYIMNHYNTFKLGWGSIFLGTIKWIFGKQKDA